MRNKGVALASVVVASIAGVVAAWTVAAQQPANPRQQPGATITMFAPEQHDLYDGHYVLSANRIHMVGGLNDPVGWDHMDNEAKTVKPVSGHRRNRRERSDEHRQIRGAPEDPGGRPGAGRSTSSTSSIRVRTAASSGSCTSTGPIPAAVTTTGPRPSCTSPDGASDTRR